MIGWIKIHRKIQKKGWYTNSSYLLLWIHLLLKANHKDTEILWNNKIIVVKRGSFVTGRNKLVAETKLNRNKIERILKCFESEHQIEQQKTTKNRLITILNYGQYQVSEQVNEQQSSNKAATSEQQVSTNNNNKNIKNNKNEKNEYTDFEFVYKNYPRKIGKKKAFTYFKNTVKTQKDYNNIQLALNNYLKDIQINKTDQKYIQYANTWFNNWHDWLDIEILKSGVEEWIEELETEKKAKKIIDV